MITILHAAIEEQREAIRLMHIHADKLRRRRLTKRYGVFVEQGKGGWRVCLVDRKSQPKPVKY